MPADPSGEGRVDATVRVMWLSTAVSVGRNHETMTPQNELERLLAARDFGPHCYPTVFRLLRESRLVFLLPCHPELTGTQDTVGPGEPLPRFPIWESPETGRRIPIFSSAQRAKEGCKAAGAPDGTYALAEMSGRELFDLLACQPEPIALNPGCDTHVLFFSTSTARELASETRVEPVKSKRKQATASIVDPADYPTDFLQPLFRFLCGRPEAQAAWLLREDTKRGAPVSYVFVLKVRGEAQELEADFRMVAGAACPKDVKYALAPFDPNNEELVKLTAQFTPFFAAPGYARISRAEER
jgi:hypothetical protein